MTMKIINEYSLSELAERTGITPRNVRFYIAQGLVPSPITQGRTARYTATHLDILRRIKSLKAEGMSLMEIQAQLKQPPLFTLEGEQVTNVRVTSDVLVIFKHSAMSAARQRAVHLGIEALARTIAYEESKSNE